MQVYTFLPICECVYSPSMVSEAERPLDECRCFHYLVYLDKLLYQYGGNPNETCVVKH